MMLPLKTHKAIYSFVNRAKKCVFLTHKLKEKVVEVHEARTRLHKWQLVNLLQLVMFSVLDATSYVAIRSTSSVTFVQRRTISSVLHCQKLYLPHCRLLLIYADGSVTTVAFRAKLNWRKL